MNSRQRRRLRRFSERLFKVQISLQTGGLTQQGFGTAMILGYPTGWTERSRTYSSITGVAADFAVSTPEYKAANAYFSQSPRPEQLVLWATSPEGDCTKSGDCPRGHYCKSGTCVPTEKESK